MKHIISLKKAAKTWEEGLPLGNGRLGATVLGKIAEENITINEETVWYGPERNRKNPDAYEHLQEVRDLLMKGEVQKAQFLAKMAITSTPKYMNPYQPAGELKVFFMNHLAKRCQNRKCYLDLDDAIAYVKYDLYGSSYVREHFVSHAYNVFAMRLTTSGDKLTICANVNRKPFEEYTKKLDDKTVCNYGQCGADGVHYFTALRIVAKGGTVKTMGDFVYAEDADEVVLYVASGTDFGTDASYKEEIISRLNKAEEAGYEKVKQTHLDEFHALYNRMSLDINHCKENEEITEVQLEQLKNEEVENNDYLTLLLFYFARYLMISSSYDCQLPANLQGIWNGTFVPPWQSEYTININTEMNYWFVEKANLSECHEPLFDLIDRLVENGKKTAKELFHCRGFCAHHNTNLWANTDPEGIMDASPFWAMGGAWLSLHMYEHYLYTEDREFLKDRALPVMREAIRFYEDYLVEGENGELLTGPSVSPENSYLSKIGIKGALCMAPTMDMQILRQLFTWYLEGAELTGTLTEEDERIIKSILNKLPKTKVSSDGRIMEWQEEYEEPEPGHRHISHLYGLHPGNEIVPEKEELFAAARKTLDYRLSFGGGHTGWSRAWITCFYARLKDGEKLLENINGLLKKSIKVNLYDTHPPFQIDGNFGIAEAMLEALVQSHNSYIEILPALPKAWKSGSLRGVRLRGAMTADLVWEDGRLQSFVITPDFDRTADVRYQDKQITVSLKAKEAKEIAGLL